MNEAQKLTWTSKNGEHQLSAWIEIGTGGVVWCAALDGRLEGKVYAPATQIPAESRKAGIVAAIGRVALSSERYEILKAEAARFALEYAASPSALRSKRETLCDAIHGAMAEAAANRERAFEADCKDGIPGYDTDDVSQAQRALAAFDAAHPEIAAAIEQELEAAAERNRWN